MRTQDLAKAIGQCLHPQSPTDANWAAGLTAAFCGLLRGAEFALQEGETFDPSRHLTRAGRAVGDCARMPIPPGEESTLVLTMCCVNAHGGARSAV